MRVRTNESGSREFMHQQILWMMTKENSLDGHIHLHIHELVPGRWLRPRRNIRTKIFSKFLCGLLLGAGFVGAMWFQWWR